MPVNREWHILRPVKSVSYPRVVVAVAVDPRVTPHAGGVYEHTFRVGSCSVTTDPTGHHPDRLRFDFATPPQWWDWLDGRCRRDTQTWVCAHNLAYTLSLLGFWDTLNHGSWTHTWSVLEDQTCIVVCRYGRRSIRFVDLQNYWRVPLAELLGAAGLRSAGTPETNPPLADALDRARRRVRVTEECVCQAIQQIAANSLGGWRSTAASTAWSVWLHSFARDPVAVHAHTDALRLESSAVYGGQLRVSRTGGVAAPITALDVNSLYPWVMATQDLPHRLIDYQTMVAPRLLRQTVERYWCCARVLAQPPWPLPWRSPAGGVEYQHALREYYVCGQTLRGLAAGDLVRQCVELSRYDAGPFLRAYALCLYERKVQAAATGDIAGRLLWKMLLNGLSGKFGQRQRRWVPAAGIPASGWWGRFPSLDLATGEVLRCRSVAGQVQRLETGPWTAESCPAVLAAITSAGRLRLQQLTELAGPEETLYADTDCVHVTTVGHERLQEAGQCHPTALGKLKVVCVGSDAYYWSAKHYRVGDYYVSCVLRASAREVSDGLYLQEARQGISRILNGDNLDRVRVVDRPVTLGTGPGCYRPSPKKEESCHES